MFYAVIGKIGVTELLVVLVIVLVVFGPTQLPKLSKVLGKTLSSFKKGMEEDLGTEESDAPAEKKKAEKESGHEAGAE